MKRGRIKAGRNTELASVAEDQFEGGGGRVDVAIDERPPEMGTDMDRQKGGRIGLGRRSGWGRGGRCAGDEEGVRVGGDRANRGRSGWRCGGVGRTGRESVPSGGNRRGLPTSRSRGTTEPWRGLRGFTNRPHLDEPPPCFKDAVHRTDTVLQPIQQAVAAVGSRFEAGLALR